MSDAHKNFAYSTVATAPSPASSGTSLVVAAGQGALFPAVPFNATVWPTSAQPTAANAEIVRVTAIASDTLTITRAQEGTAARTVVVGDQIAATTTAKTLADVENRAVAGAGGTETVSAPLGSLVAGSVSATAGTTAVLGAGAGSAAQGTAKSSASSGSYASVQSFGSGSFAQGYATASGGGQAAIEASDNGAFAKGYAFNNGPSGSYATIQARGFAIGRAVNFGSGYSKIRAPYAGSFAVGDAGNASTGHALISTVYAHGAAAMGRAYATGSGAAAIQATSYGSFAQGYAQSTGSGGASILTSGPGGFAQGKASASSSDTSVVSGAAGSFAQGYATAGGAITAYGPGSFAQGYANASTISATAANAVQFGLGTNDLADSLAVGVAFRFKGTTGAPGSPRDGDAWIESNTFKIRLGGATKTVTVT